MNRILLDEALCSNNDNIKKYEINNDTNALLNDSYDNYEFNIKKGNVNLLFINEIKKNIYIKFNIYESNTVFNFISFSCSNLKIDVNLKNEKSSFETYNSFILNDNNNIEVNVNHENKNTVSNIYNHVITKDNASSKIKVVSFVPKGCKNCIVNQDSKIISFNDVNENKIEPILLIDEFETEAKHSAYIGKFNYDEIFYLKTRALNEKEIYKLLMEANLIGIMKIEDEEKKYLKQKLNK